MRVEEGSCGKGFGCVAESDEEADVDEVLVPSSSVLEEMPKSAVEVAEST